MGLKKNIERGGIFLVCLDPTVGSKINKTRPALIISNNINNRVSDTVTVIPITANARRIFPFEVFFAPEKTGLSRESKAKCNQIRTIDKKRLIKYLGKIMPEEIQKIEDALLIHLGIEISK